MTYDVPMDNVNPTLPKDPVVIPRHRPGAVPVASALMICGALLGVASSVALFTASDTVPKAFALKALDTDVSPAAIDAAFSTIRSTFLGSGVVTLSLSLLVGSLAYGVARGNNPARIGAVAAVLASLFCGLGSTSYTALGRDANWTARLEGAGEQVSDQIGQTYAEVMPTWFVGLAGGLTDLQALSYIAVAVLKVWDAHAHRSRHRSHLRDRRRLRPPASGRRL
jgi:hypothetical protein